MTIAILTRRHPVQADMDQLVMMGSKVPYWQGDKSYRKAYEAAQRAKIEDCVAVEFQSIEGAAAHSGLPVDQFVKV